MAISRDEIFGPVLTILTAESDAEAIKIDTEYGLHASVFYIIQSIRDRLI
ncbi:MAG: aldehyde dehydrogenase family protein [Spirochaetales bacterium]|jgi:acyl-CoA reductase-like NAD-dependent aldehyde dehydrogenase|nr:aldehyde dehydrogenase family protein [Spirochaetales bacterium]